MILLTLNKVIIKCTVHCTVPLHCTLYLCLACSLSLSLTHSYIHTKVSDSDILAWVRGQRKMSQVLDVFGLLDFAML
jgi:hypothetical protein